LDAGSLFSAERIIPMKTTLVTGLLLLTIPLGVFAQDEKKTSLWDSKQVVVDLKAMDQSHLGLDYSFQLNKEFDKNSVKLSSKGFLTLNGVDNQFDSIINMLELDVKLFQVMKASPSVNTGDLNDVTVGEISLIAQKVQSPLWVDFFINAGHETTQNFRNYDFVVGSGLSISTSYLHEPLDFLFQILRTRPNNNPRFLDLSLSYNLVKGMDRTASAVLRAGKEDANRLTLEAEWETGVLDYQRISFRYMANYEFDAPAAVKVAGQDFNYFFEAKLILYEFKKAEAAGSETAEGPKLVPKISVKYTEGKLPPNYVQDSVLGGGLSLEF
jgi:hypothetical protein